ncbi:MAG: ABC-2 family transporter protein [Anaerolineae bacterium]|nr:ABC-2 family transporter protein [Anaerolineae bacterium]
MRAIYRAFYRTNLAVQMQYRVAAVIWLLGTVLHPVIYLVVWATVAEAEGGSVGGYSGSQFAAYYITMMVVDHLTFDWHMWEYDYRIREGLLSPVLLRPLHPIHSDIADNLAYKTLTMLVVAPAAILLSLFFRPEFNAPLWAVLAFTPSVVLAFLLRFLSSWALAMTAFWTTRIDAINQSYFVAELFFAGLIAPLALLPGPLRLIANLLPFRWGLAFPVELFLGRLSPLEALTGFGAQLLWIALSLVALRLIWRAGIRRYSAFGA